MPTHVNITIDCSTIRVYKGMSVLDAALERGICIPHLCHMSGLMPNGACRLCIVERLDGHKRTITTSCTLEAREGLVVQTSSERVRRLRKNIAELLVAEAPNSRAIQDMAVRCGVRKVRYPFHNRDCVLCGRCVRLCSLGRNVLGFVGRGNARHVDFAFGHRPEECSKCEGCIEHCPMTAAPCPGTMAPGKERLCGECESQLSMNETLPDTCVRCRLGKGFECSRWAGIKTG